MAPATRQTVTRAQLVTGGRDTTDLLAEACEELGDLLATIAATEIMNGRSCAGIMTAATMATDIDVNPGMRHTSHLESRVPGNSAVLNAATDAHACVRDVERKLRYAATGGAGTPRGGSDANTTAALKAIPKLGAAASSHDRQHATRMLTTAAKGIQRLAAIDIAVEWQPLRRGAGGLPPLCPWCSTYSLRYAPTTGIIRCVFPACQDDDGKPPVGRLDVSKIDGSPVLAWRSGLVQYAPSGGGP